MNNYNQFSNLSCYEEFEIQVALTGISKVDVLKDEYGPDHDKHFVSEVHLNSNVIGKGEGKSKKEAEQQAAKEALELMGR